MDEHPYTVEGIAGEREAELRRELEAAGWRLEVGGNDEWCVAEAIDPNGRRKRLGVHRRRLEALSVALRELASN